MQRKMVDSTFSSRDEELQAIAREREEILQEDLATPDSRQRFREFYYEVLRERSNHRYLFDFFPQQYRLEDDLRPRLRAFEPVSSHDLYVCSKPDLKFIRRWALRRYAFGLAHDVNSRLRLQRERRWWLWKDYLFPRIPLALLVGYSAVLGSIGGQLWELRESHWAIATIVPASLLASWFLIYSNVRDLVGNIREAWTRSFGVFLCGLIWCLLFMWAASSFCAATRTLTFHSGHATLVSSTSLMVAVVAQFFFTRSGSIADPL